MSDKHIEWLTNLSKNDTRAVGNKGANLGELFNAKFPIPQAFVVTTGAFLSFLKENKLTDEIKSILKRIDVDDKDNLREKSEEIQNLIANAPMPDKMREEILEAYDNFNVDLKDLKDSPGALSILKSSREPIFISIRASLDGEEEKERKDRRNFINIRGNNELIDKIRICFTTVFTPSSIAYRRDNGLDDFTTMAVIIQRMINSDKSGKILTKIKDDEEDNLLITTIFGQGDVSGKIIPDEYLLTRDMEVTDEKIGDKKFEIIRTGNGQTKYSQLSMDKSSARVLKTYEIKQLADLAIKIEKHFDAPQIIEFAIENEDIHILMTKEIVRQKLKKGGLDVLPVIETNTKLKIIANSLEDVNDGIDINCSGIGLIRIEKIIAKGRKHPLRYEEEGSLGVYQSMIEDELKKVVNTYGEKPVWVRTSDIQSDKYGSLLETHGKPERNPALGNHGIRFSLKHIEIFRRELLAIKNSNENKNISIMLPQVISPAEIKRTKDLLQELDMGDMKIGISLETPSAAILIKDICDEGIDFVSLNLDDLTQYTLVADEENDRIQDIFEETSWAVLKLISRVIRECKTHNIETSIFGRATNKTRIIEFLVKRGIDSITTSPNAARKFSELIYKFENGKDYVSEQKIGNNLKEGGNAPMEEEKVLDIETVEEEAGEAGEENEIEGELDNNEHSEENLKNPLEPEVEPVEQHNKEKENPDKEPIDEDKPKTEDIFN